MEYCCCWPSLGHTPSPGLDEDTDTSEEDTSEFRSEEDTSVILFKRDEPVTLDWVALRIKNSRDEDEDEDEDERGTLVLKDVGVVPAEDVTERRISQLYWTLKRLGRGALSGEA